MTASILPIQMGRDKDGVTAQQGKSDKGSRMQFVKLLTNKLLASYTYLKGLTMQPME